jgi:hypothetical protein
MNASEKEWFRTRSPTKLHHFLLPLPLSKEGAENRALHPLKNCTFVGLKMLFVSMFAGTRINIAKIQYDVIMSTRARLNLSVRSQ